MGQILYTNNENDEEKNKIQNKNKILKDEFTYICQVTKLYDLNMNIIIPKFEAKDIIYLFFTFENFEQYYYGPVFDEIYKVENLYLELFKNINQQIKNLITFKDVTGKIALMFFKYFNKDILELPQFIDGENILQYIENKNNNKLVNFEKINVLINLIKLGKYFDEYKVQSEQIEKMNNENNKKFTFEDFECFKN